MLKKIKIAAVRKLLQTDQGLVAVKEGLSSQNDSLRHAAVFGLAQVVENSYFFDRDNGREKESDERNEEFIEFLLPFLEDKQPKIRERVLRLLVYIERVTLDIIDRALEDEDVSCRSTALNGLQRFNIDNSNAAILDIFI